MKPNDVASIVARLMSNIDSLARSSIRNETVYSLVLEDLDALQNHPGYRIIKGSENTLVHICALAIKKTNYHGKRLAHLLGIIKAEFLDQEIWESSKNDVCLVEGLVICLHNHERFRRGYERYSALSCQSVLSSYLDANVDENVDWEATLAPLEHIKVVCLSNVLNSDLRYFDAEFGAHLLYCRGSQHEAAQALVDRHFAKLSELLPGLEWPDLYIGKTFFVFDCEIRRSIYLEQSTILIFKVFPCLVPLYDMIRNRLEQDEKLAEILLFAQLRVHKNLPYESEGSRLSTILYHLIVTGVDKPYLDRDYEHHQLIIDLFAWETIATSQEFRPLKVSIVPTLQRTSAENIERFDIYTKEHSLKISFFALISDVADELFPSPKTRGLLRSHSRLWMSLRFGLPVETYKTIDTWSGQQPSTALDSSILREAAAQVGRESTERRTSVVKFFLKRYGKRHVSRGTISQTILEAIIALQIAIDDIRTGILYMPDSLRNVGTFEQLHQIFGGSRIEAFDAGLVCNAFLSFSAFRPISGDFEISKETLMEAWNQRLALYFPNGGHEFDIVLPCIRPTRANYRKELFEPTTPDIRTVSFVAIKVLSNDEAFLAKRTLDPLAVVKFTESKEKKGSLPNYFNDSVTWFLIST